MDRAELVPAESHGVLLMGLGAVVEWGLAGEGIDSFSSRKALRSPFSQRLDPQPGGGVAGKHLADADVSGEHFGRLVAGLAHDVALADSVHRCLGDASGPLQDPADAVLVEAAAGGLANPSDPAKDSSGGDARHGEPALQGAHRAGCLLFPKGNADLAAGGLLVGLRAAEIDDQTVFRERKVGAIDRGQLRAAEGASEADKHQRPVAET